MILILYFNFNLLEEFYISSLSTLAKLHCWTATAVCTICDMQVLWTATAMCAIWHAGVVNCHSNVHHVTCRCCELPHQCAPCDMQVLWTATAMCAMWLVEALLDSDFQWTTRPVSFLPPWGLHFLGSSWHPMEWVTSLTTCMPGGIPQPWVTWLMEFYYLSIYSKQ